MTEKLSSGNTIPPEHRTPDMALKAVTAHIEYTLEVLHDLCSARGLSTDIENSLRAHLLEELESYKNLPPELTLQEKIDLGDNHFAAADERNRIAGLTKE